MGPKVSVGSTSLAGWGAAVVGLLPVIVKSVEAGQVAFNGPEKWLAIAGIVAGAITQVGRYLQSVHLIKAGTEPAKARKASV